MNDSNKKNQSINMDKLKKAISEKGWSVAQFGEKLGMPQRNMITSRLNNKTSIVIDEYIDMCRLLDRKVEDFVSVKDN